MGGKWRDLPESVKVVLAAGKSANMLRRKQETAHRREMRVRLGIGEGKSTCVRLPRKSLHRLRACAHARRALCFIRDEKVEYFGKNMFSMSEEIRRQIDLAYERFVRQLEYLADSADKDPRADNALEKMYLLDSGWQ